jgi:hypothetical protein
MNRNEELIKTLTDCARVCQMCAAACLSEKDVNMLAECIKTDFECAEICLVAANSLQRNSTLAGRFLDICAEACHKCAEECEKHSDHMEHCRICEEACRKCEELCHVFV